MQESMHAGDGEGCKGSVLRVLQDSVGVWDRFCRVSSGLKRPVIRAGKRLHTQGWGGRRPAVDFPAQ